MQGHISKKKMRNESDAKKKAVTEDVSCESELGRRSLDVKLIST